MSCTHWRDATVSWMQARWQGREEPLPEGLLEHAAGCRACAARREAARRLCEGPEQRPSPPPELSATILRALRATGAAEPTGAAAPARRSAWAPALRWGLLPAAAALAAALGTAAFFGAFAPRAGGLAGEPAVRVRFVLEAPQAGRVSLVADWNRWDPEAQPLGDPDGDGGWEIEVTLRPGMEQQYQFLVDGELWVPDPGAPLKVEDGMGGYKSVLQI